MRPLHSFAFAIVPFILWSCACCGGTAECAAPPAAPTAAAPATATPAAETMPTFERYPEQELLKNLAGEWDCENWMLMDPSQPAMLSKGTMSSRLQSPNEYWVIADYKSEMMGMAFSGHSIFGYDTTLKKWVGTWIDSMAPVIMNSVADWNPATRTWTAHASFIDPASGQTMKFKMTTEVRSADNHFFTMFILSPEGEFKNMTINYTRRK